MSKTFAKPAHFWLKSNQSGNCEVFGAQIFSHHTRENPEDFKVLYISLCCLLNIIDMCASCVDSAQHKALYGSCPIQGRGSIT